MSAVRLSTPLLILAVALAACGGGSDASAVSADPSVAASATAEPTPSPSPVDIAGEFVSNLAAMTELATTISGTMTIGELEGDISGHLRVTGRDQHFLTIITFPGIPAVENEAITVDGVSYQRIPTGIWMQTEAGGASQTGTDPISAALSRADDLEVVGTEVIGGTRLHRLEANEPVVFGPQSLGVTDPSVADFGATVGFLAEDDGTPAAIVINAAWKQGPPESPVPAMFEMRVEFNIGAAVTIEAPPDPWTTYTSAELGYRIAHPVDWDVTYQPGTDELLAGDLFVGPVDGEVQAYRYDDIPVDITPNLYFRGSAQVTADAFGAEPEVVEELTLANGLPVRVFNLQIEQDGVLYFFQQAAIYGGPVGWDLSWYSPARLRGRCPCSIHALREVVRTHAVGDTT